MISYECGDVLVEGLQTSVQTPWANTQLLARQSFMTSRIHFHCHCMQFHYQEKYIDTPANVDWYEKYKDDIPVIHINGEYLMKHKVNEWLLKRTLNQLTH